MLRVVEVAHQRVGLGRVLILGLGQEAVRAGDAGLRGLRLGEYLDSEGGDNAREAHRVVHGPLGGADGEGAYPVLRDAGEVRVEDGRKAVNHILPNADREMHQLVAHRVVAHHGDDYEGVRVDVDEVEALYRRRRRGRDGHGRVVRHSRGQGADAAQKLVELAELAAQVCTHLS